MGCERGWPVSRGSFLIPSDLVVTRMFEAKPSKLERAVSVLRVSPNFACETAFAKSCSPSSSPGSPVDSTPIAHKNISDFSNRKERVQRRSTKPDLRQSRRFPDAAIVMESRGAKRCHRAGGFDVGLLGFRVLTLLAVVGGRGIVVVVVDGSPASWREVTKFGASFTPATSFQRPRGALCVSHSESAQARQPRDGTVPPPMLGRSVGRARWVGRSVGRTFLHSLVPRATLVNFKCVRLNGSNKSLSKAGASL